MDAKTVCLDIFCAPMAGGPFDPLGLASNPEKAAGLKEAEIKHARLAMVAFLGEFHKQTQVLLPCCLTDICCVPCHKDVCFF